jgi:hypothetical protein
MADPYHRSGSTGLWLVMPARGPATAGAYAACQHLLAPIIAAKIAHARAVTATVRLGLIQYAQCMRRHAVPMLDPNADGTLSLGNVPGLSNGFGRYTPQFHVADRDCRHLLPPSIPDNGTGP